MFLKIYFELLFLACAGLCAIELLIYYFSFNNTNKFSFKKSYLIALETIIFIILFYATKHL